MSDRLRFEVGKIYIHASGKRIFIAGAILSKNYGLCLIGETDTGQLVPIGNDEDSPINWSEELLIGKNETNQALPIPDRQSRP